MKLALLIFLTALTSLCVASPPHKIPVSRLYAGLINRAIENKLPFAVSNSKGSTIALGDEVQFFFAISGTAKNVLIAGKVIKASAYPKVVKFPNGTIVQIGRMSESAILSNNKMVTK